MNRFNFWRVACWRGDLFAWHVLNKELDIQGEEAGQNAAKVLISASNEIHSGGRSLVWDALHVLSPT